MNLLKIIKWALGLLIFALRTPFVDFKITILDPAKAKELAKAIEDGSVTDEELADLLELIQVEL